MRRHHGRAECDDADALEIMADVEGIRELESFAADPVIAATMAKITTKEVIGEPRRARQVAARFDGPRAYSPFPIEKKRERASTGGKPTVQEMGVLMAQAQGGARPKITMGRPKRRGMSRRGEPTVREYGREIIRTRDGEQRETSIPRWVTRESHALYQDGKIIERGESVRYEYD